MNRMNFMPFKTEKFGKKGLFGNDRASKDSEDGAPQISMFNDDEETKKKKQAEKDEKLANLRKRLEDAQVPTSVIDEGHIGYALRSRYSLGDEDKAFELLLFMKDAISGIVRPYDPNVHMLGAVNRGNVTCWLDATLFAMFSNLTSFEPMLHATFEDSKKSRLVVLIRLWVNLLRAGKLIEIDLTHEIQDTLKSCGWEQAGELCQNDASEAFSFITGTLGLPLLTMEMDIFHEGGTDEADHKIINERLLEVAIPQSNDGVPVRLEDCLEEHFNTRVEVMRRMTTRRDTLTSRHAGSPKSPLPPISPELPDMDDEKPAVVHLDEMKSTDGAHDEATPILSDSPTTISESPVDLRPSLSRTMASLRRGESNEVPLTRPAMNRDRATSIIRRIVVSNDADEPGPSPMRSSPRPPSMAESMRKGSVRKEVLMPAWQFFRILPWYTTDVPANDDQVAAHFSKSSPVIGICLKRYGWSAKGVAIRSNTVLDIPLQIALPHFIQDEMSTQDGAPIFGNFKMVLQSMVCHRGDSVNSGHYISIIRAGRSEKHSSPQQSPSGGPPAYSEDQWVKLDDLNHPRTEFVSIDDAMKRETPYLLFYQVQPMFDEPPLDSIPPPYQTSEALPSDPPIPYEEEDSMLSARRMNITIDTRNDAPMPASSSGQDPISSSAVSGNGHKQGVLSVAIQEASPLQEPSDTGYFPSNNTSESWTKPRISMSSDTERTNTSLLSFGAEGLAHSFSEADMDKQHDHRPFTASEDYRGPELDKAPTQSELGTRLSRAASRLGLGPRSNKSRPPSQHDESRKTGTFSRLSLMRLKEKEKDEKKDKDKDKEKDKETSGTDSAKKSPENSSADASVATSSTDLAVTTSSIEVVDSDFDVRSEKTEKADYADMEMKHKDKDGKKKEKSEKSEEHKDKDKDHHKHPFHRGHGKTNSTSSAGTEKEKPDRECSLM